MSHTPTHTPTPAPVDPQRLVDVLERLRDDGMLSAAQVAGVLAALGTPAPTGPTDARAGRLVEAAAYAGAVLVAASAALLVGQRWEALGRDGRVTVLAGVTVLLALVGVVVATLRPRGRAALLRPAQSVRRRLAGTVLSGAAVSAASTVALLDPDGNVPAALTAVVLVTVVQRAAPGAVPEVVTFGSAAYLAGAALISASADGAVVVLTYALLGAAWAAAAGTAAFTAPVPAPASGLSLLLVAGTAGTWGSEQPAEGAGFAVLVVLAVVGLAGFCAAGGGRWPRAAPGRSCWTSAATASARPAASC